MSPKPPSPIVVPTPAPPEPVEIGGVHFGGWGQTSLVRLTPASREILARLYQDPFTKIWACNDRDSTRALRPFLIKE